MHHRPVVRGAALGLALAVSSTPASALARHEPAIPTPQDLRSPDARDAALGRPAPSEVVVVTVRRRSPAVRGFHWRDAATGAGGALGLCLVGLGSASAVSRRRRPRAAREPVEHAAVADGSATHGATVSALKMTQTWR